MRLGISHVLSHSCPEEWAERNRELGLSAVVFPCAGSAPDETIDGYGKAAKDYDLFIAEVGAWCNPISKNTLEREKNKNYCIEQLRLAERVGARCCVNIAGSCGELWDGGYKENYADETFELICRTVQEILDAVQPKNTVYALEPMPWMMPDSPEAYLRLVSAINRQGFGVHMDIVNMISSPERYFFNEKFMEHCFDLLGDKIKSCHVKNVHLESKLTFQLREVACSEGELNLAKYAELANRADKNMPFIIEHLPNEEAYLSSVETIKTLLKEAGIERR